MGDTRESGNRQRREQLAARLPKNDEKKLMAIPGLYYGGGCSYMACRGLMMGPIRDVLLITHGPTGCGCFAGINGRREQNDGERQRHDGRIFSTDMREEDIVFGGEEKLKNAIAEAVERYRPKAIAVCATCPVGLIGDDIENVAKTAEATYKIPVLPLSCEGFRANDGGWLLGGKMIAKHWLGTKDEQHGPFSVHYMSESYVGENKRRIDDLFDRIGCEIVASMMGATTYEEIQTAHTARLILLDSGKAIDEVPQALSEQYGSGFFRVDFTGIGNLVDSLRRIAAFFDDEALTARTERVIAEELARIEPDWRRYREQFSGMKAALFEDIFRSDHFAALSSDLGLDIIMIAEDFARTDYSDENFTVHLPPHLGAALGASFSLTEEAGGRLYGRGLSRRDVTALLHALRPDICFAGVEEQFAWSDAPIRSELFTSEERGVQYGGFDGILRFGHDLEMAVFMSHWVTAPPPWMSGTNQRETERGDDETS